MIRDMNSFLNSTGLCVDIVIASFFLLSKLELHLILQNVETE